MSRKAMLQSRLLLHQHDNLRCHGYGCLPPLKRRCFSRSKTLSSSSHPTLSSRNHDRIQYPPELPDNLCHSAKEKEEDKEFFLDLLSSATTKREAKSYLSRFTPPKPPLVNTQPKEEATDDLKAVNSNEKYFNASLMSSTQANTLPAEPNLSTSKCAATETLRVALIKIKNPEMLDDQCLHGISKTLSQLSRLAMGCCIVVEVDITENDIDYRKLASAQASRIAAKIDKVHCLGARRLESVISLNAPTQRLSVLSRKSLLSPLYRGQIVVIDPIGYTKNTSKALPIPADELVLALTKELAGLEYNPELSEAAAESVQNIKQRQQEVSVERLIVLDPLGGIPSLGRGQHKSHPSPFSHLPPPALITTPQDATNLPKTRHDTLGTPTVGTRQRRNPLIHNLLTDKPVLSASLPARRRGDEKGDHVPNTQLPHSTFVKHGMPLTMIPDPRVKCWTAAHNEGSRINLDDPAVDLPRLVHLIDDSFNRKLDVNHYLDRVKNRLAGLIIAGEYEGGAILTWELPPGVPDDGSPESMARMVPYLDKFAVLKRSQGAGGVADVVFNAMVRTCFPEGVCWRSRKNNPVNKWYFERSRGTWKLPDSNWAMFWTTDNVPENEQLFEDYESVCRSIQPSWADNKKEVD
ncbi:acetylglutamate synthase [Microsporum canis CBS 113480]|uniref:Amino-acid acetyltransferase, mitochondrial n=1 Tax=Arthroderma otae (strain ATCC MYA-4605 / CBS 113480) TaxID=554155 RepID=C5FFI5_ARTOC|nr:acetylglutamate synthase [Microsporum canis CBS 113480]EEQ29432.1 acetylglutamate synthase [Microsporum canis CBS 113480]